MGNGKLPWLGYGIGADPSDLAGVWIIKLFLGGVEIIIQLVNDRIGRVHSNSLLRSNIGATFLSTLLKILPRYLLLLIVIKNRAFIHKFIA